MPLPFMTHEQLLDKLEQEKHLTIPNRENAQALLEKIGYFALINGYKTPFLNPTTKKYKDGTTFNEIVALYQFDEALRALFLDYLLRIERHMRASISYYFTQEYGNEQAAYLTEAHYNTINKNRRGIAKLIWKLEHSVNESTAPYIIYQKNTYQNVPLQILINTVTFGTLFNLYRFLPSKLQSKISENCNIKLNTC